MKIYHVICMFVSAVVLSFGPLTPQVQAQCLGDVIPSGIVDGQDIALILSQWGTNGGSTGADINGDNIVNAVDLAFVLGGWGVCPGTVTSVTPREGPILGGTQITIEGTYLSGTTAVQVGGVDCTSLQVLSQTLVTAVTPAGEAGKVSISLISPEGTLMSPTPFTYIQSSISSVSPTQGIYSGGTAITITGTFLDGVTSVKVGGVPATNVVVVNSTTVTAVTPAGSVGSVSVEVTGLNGTATASGAFTYISVTVPSWATLLEALPDPAVVTNADLRAAITATGLAWRVRDNNESNIEMLLVPPGTFTMGCSASVEGSCIDFDDETPLHQVTLTNAFYLGRYEVTQAQWYAEMNYNPSSFQGPDYQNSASRPVERVYPEIIHDFCTQTGLSLPTEAEWEYAYRAGTTTAFHSMPGYPNGTNDDNLLGNIAWYASNSDNQTHAVGGKAANALGLHDMSGNIWEYCHDWYGSDYYSNSPGTNPTGPTSGSSKSMRGGSWIEESVNCRSSRRNHFVQSCFPLPCGGGYNGFRVARNP